VRDDRLIGNLAYPPDRGLDLGEIVKCLDREQIDAPFGERGRLLGEDLNRLVDRRRTPRLARAAPSRLIART